MWLKSFGTHPFFPPVEEEGEKDGHRPVGNSIRDVRLGAAVVESRENIRFGKHVHHLDGEDESQELNGLQVVGEEGRKRHDESLRQDDAGEGMVRSHTHGDRCLVLSLIDRAERAADILGLVRRVVKDEGRIDRPVRADIEGLHGMAKNRRNDRSEKEGQRIVHDEELHDARHGAEKGDQDGEDAIQQASPAQAEHRDERAEDNARDDDDKGHEKGIRDRARDEKECGRQDFKIDHTALLSLGLLHFWNMWNAISTRMTSAQ